MIYQNEYLNNNMMGVHTITALLIFTSDNGLCFSSKPEKIKNNSKPAFNLQHNCFTYVFVLIKVASTIWNKKSFYNHEISTFNNVDLCLKILMYMCKEVRERVKEIQIRSLDLNFKINSATGLWKF